MFFIFDLDDTLVDTSGSVTPVLLKRALASLGLESSQALDALLKINQSARSSESALKKFLQDSAIFDTTSPGVFEKTLEILQKLPPDLSIKPVHYTHEILEVFRGHQFAIVTVGFEEFQIDKLKKAGFDLSLFSKIIVTKEKNKGFHYAELLKEFQWDPIDTVVIGDRIEIDLTPAKRLGCNTVHLLRGRGAATHPSGPLEDADYTIERLEELVDIIAKLCPNQKNEFFKEKE